MNKHDGLSNGEQHRGKRPLPTWLIFPLYSLLTILMTWPVVGQLGTHIPGRIGDAYAHLWTFRWIKQALLTGQNIYQTDLLFYPHGTSLINHNIAWLHVALWLPLQALIGETPAYSLVYLIAFPLNGLALYLLARELTRSQLAAFIGGLIFAFWPYNLSHHGHPNLVLLCWLPLTLLFLRRLLRGGNWRDGLWTAVSLALLGITRWQLLIIGGFLIVLYGLYELITNVQARTWAMVGKVTAVPLLAFLLMFPLLAPVLNYQLRRDNPQELLLAEEEPYATDLLAYVIPSSYQPWWGDAALEMSGHFIGNPIYTRAIGYTTLLLALLGIISQWRHTWFWLIAALFYILLALGPQLTINGLPSLTLPYHWIENSFIIQLVRFPDRFNSVLGIPLAILATFGLLSIVHSAKNRYALRTTHYAPNTPISIYKKAVLFLLTLLILTEYASRFATMPLATPAWYQTVANEPDSIGILDMPMETQGRSDKTYMLYQLTHGQPLVGGHISRPSQDVFAFIDSVPLLRDSLDQRNPPDDVFNVSDQLNLLAEANIPYLILHKQFLRPNQVANWRQWLIIKPTYEDDELIVYRTQPPQVERDYDITAVFPTTPIALIQANLTTDEVNQGDWLTIETQWVSTAVPTQDYAVCLLLPDVEPNCQPLTPDWPTSQWGADALIQTSFPVQPSPFLAAGNHTAQLALQAEDGILTEAITIGQVTANSRPRTYTPPEPEQTTAVTWHNTLHLLGYDQQNQTLTLHWQAEQRLPQSYKIFIHLRDASGTLISQVDYVPQNWSYPTSWWEAGEYVRDDVTLPLSDLPPGKYQLWLGIYDPDTNERLVPQTADSQTITANAVHLLTLTR